jgi:hypothetical protein
MPGVIKYDRKTYEMCYDFFRTAGCAKYTGDVAWIVH